MRSFFAILRVRGRVHQAGGIRAFDLDHPALAVGVAVQRSRDCRPAASLTAGHFASHRGIRLRRCLDRTRPRQSACRPATVSPTATTIFHEDDIRELALGIVGQPSLPVAGSNHSSVLVYFRLAGIFIFHLHKKVDLVKTKRAHADSRCAPSVKDLRDSPERRPTEYRPVLKDCPIGVPCERIFPRELSRDGCNRVLFA